MPYKPGHTWIPTPGGGGYWMSEKSERYWNGEPEGTVRSENYNDGTGTHYYDSANNELTWSKKDN